MSARIVIAVDGFSSAGKSTFAKLVASRLGYIFIDTGAMYRAVTLFAIKSGADKDEEIVELLPDIDISFRYNPNRQASDIYLNGVNVEADIRSLAVSERVSHISSIAAVRTKLVALQQEMGRDKGVVMDGRDIGTVVFPDAELKIFVTADPRVRARRRYDELRSAGVDTSYEEVERNVISRDKADQSRAVSPLRQAPDAIVLDNSMMTVEQQLEWLQPHLDKLKVKD